MKRIERIRLYPTARQERALGFMLDVTRELYNALLQERRDAYRVGRVFEQRAVCRDHGIAQTELLA